MGLLSKLFGIKDNKRTEDDLFKDITISNAEYENIALIRKRTIDNNILIVLTDKEIAFIAGNVFSRFNKTASEKNENLNFPILMSLTESFIYCYQLHGIKYFIKHLQYELIKYENEGLRQDYIDGSQKWDS